MTSPAQRSWWKRAPFWVAVACAVGVQFALLSWLSDRSPVVRREGPAAPVLRIDADRPAELLAFEDPTLFVLPHRDSFSGRIWVPVPQQLFQLPPWWESPRWLLLPEQQLGLAFSEFARTNPVPYFQTIIGPAPETPAVAPPPPIVTKSTLRIEGDLAGRGLRSKFDLPGFAASDLLSNSVVQVLVDARGNAFSRALLARSGSDEADRRALDVAQLARFAPARPGRTAGAAEPEPTIGTLVFEWQTLPRPATNGAAGGS